MDYICLICFSILLLLFYYYFINPSVRLSLQSAETNGQYLPPQTYNAALDPLSKCFWLDAFTSSSSYVAALLLYFKWDPSSGRRVKRRPFARYHHTRTGRGTSHSWWGACACMCACVSGGGPSKCVRKALRVLRLILLPSHRRQRALLKRAKLSRLPAESKPGRTASLTVILLLSCSRARKYYW